MCKPICLANQGMFRVALALEPLRGKWEFWRLCSWCLKSLWVRTVLKLLDGGICRSLQIIAKGPMLCSNWFLGTLFLVCLFSKTQDLWLALYSRIQVQKLKHIALGDAAASPDHFPQQPSPQPAFDLATLRVPYQTEDFASTQHGPGLRLPQAGEEEEFELEPEEEDAEPGPNSLERPPDSVAEVVEDLPPQDPPAGEKPLVLDEVRASDFGFGENGVTVQPDGLFSRHWTDRAILKHTLLTGKPKMTRKEACDKMRTSREQGRRKALPKEKWTAVMAAAAEQHSSILQLQGETLCLKVVPDTAQGKVKYHNELMRACGLTLRELVAAMEKASSNQERKRQEDRRKRPRDEE